MRCFTVDKHARSQLFCQGGVFLASADRCHFIAEFVRESNSEVTQAVDAPNSSRLTAAPLQQNQNSCTQPHAV
jgi:hypothetical protein